MELSNVLNFTNIANNYPAFLPCAPDGIPLTSIEWKEYVDRAALGYAVISDKAILEHIQEYLHSDDEENRRIRLEQEYHPLTPEQSATRKKRATNMAIARTMNNGMLWYDDDNKRQFDEKVARAVEFYRAKYGVQPTECYVHPGMLGAEQAAVTAGVRLRANRTVIKNHFWLGVGEGAQAAPVSKPAAGRDGSRARR